MNTEHIKEYISNAQIGAIVKLDQYQLNLDVIDKLFSKNVNIVVDDYSSSNRKSRRLKSMLTFPYDDDDYNQLVENISNEIEQSEFRQFHTPVLSSGIIIDPVTDDLVMSFFTRIFEE